MRGTPVAPPSASGGIAGAEDAFPISLLVFGTASELAQRRAALTDVRGQMEFKATFNASRGSVRGLTPPLDTQGLMTILEQTSSNLFDYTVCDCVPDPKEIDCSPMQTYKQFVDFLEATAPKTATLAGGTGLGLAVTTDATWPREETGGRTPAMRVWLELMPPTEAAHGFCLPPTDDPRTPWNETALFNQSLGYLDYHAWAILAGKLAAKYPQLTALNIDDFTNDVGIGKPFPPDLVAKMTTALRGQGAPWMGLATCVYYTQDGVWSFGRWPDLPMVVDATTFAFRNELQGIGPCMCTVERQCPWGSTRTTPCPTAQGPGGCLAGACADPTVLNAPLEVAHMTTRLPPGRKILFTFYATGHSSLGQPTPTYVAALMEMAAHLPEVSGVLVYTTKATPKDNPDCDGLAPPTFGGEMGCIVRDAFRRMSGDFVYAAVPAARGVY